MTSPDFALLALQLAAMLGTAVVFGQLLRRLGQPAVLGEMLGGVILGPTVVGALLPGAYAALFHASPSVDLTRDSAIKLGMLFFLFVAGLETNLTAMRRLASGALLIGLVGTLLPIMVGVALVGLLPAPFWDAPALVPMLPFALFVGMILANSANPVIARILMDLGLLRSELGQMIMAATLVDDLVNWTLFAVILGQLAPSAGAATDLPVSLALILGFVVLVLAGGRWLAVPVLRWLRQHIAWPTGFIAITTLLILVVSAISESLGIHAFLGAFLLGAAVGGRDDEKNEAIDAISHFALSFFAPLYFVSMGLGVDFIAHFDPALVLVIVVAAVASKLGAVLLGARMAGLPLDRRAVAIGVGLNARGATGIILAGIGLEHGLLDERLFVAMVVMAIVTSLMSAPALRWLTRRAF